MIVHPYSPLLSHSIGDKKIAKECIGVSSQGVSWCSSSSIM
jgi:hypothetical protein